MIITHLQEQINMPKGKKTRRGNKSMSKREEAAAAAMKAVAAEVPSITFTPASLEFKPPASFTSVPGGLQGVLDTYKLDITTLQTVFGEEATTMFSQDFQRADLNLFQVHSEVQPRKCLEFHMLERVEALLSAGSWLAHNRFIYTL